MNSLYLHLIVIVFGFTSIYGADSEECEHDAEDSVCELNDVTCMVDYLASNSRCKKAPGPVRDCVTFPRRTFLVPIINSTVTVRKPVISGFKNVKMVAFNRNTSSSNLILAFQMQHIEKEYRDTTVMIHRRAQEPITFNNNFVITMGPVTFTAVIPCLPHLDLSSATVYADFDSPDITFIDNTHYEDRKVRDTMKALRDSMITAAKESMATEARLFAEHFIQMCLCDFGLELRA